MPLASFTPQVREWFERAFAAPTPAQEQAWPAIATGEHTLISAPTGSGKTLAAFLWALDRLAAELARLALVEADLASVGSLAIEALCARVVDRLRAQFERLGAVADQPGLPRALARTLDELRMAGATEVPGAPDLSAALRELETELAAKKLADRACVYRIAAEVAERELALALSSGGPEYVIARYYLAQVHMKKGNRAQAVSELKAYLEKSPEGELAARARKLLEKLNN